MTTGAIIVAAGRSERMGGIDKLLYPVAGRPLIAYAIDAFLRAPAIDALIVVTSGENRGAVEALLPGDGTKARVVIGGVRRRDSVRAGLDALPNCDYVVIHDGARPLVEPSLIAAAIEGAQASGAALCAVPVTDTVKRATDDAHVYGTVSRERLWLAQTPQAFRRDVLLRAHAAFDIDATDDAALVEMLEEPVRIVTGSRRNIKVTTPDDLDLVVALLGAGEA